jgi:hypothetical protein
MQMAPQPVGAVRLSARFVPATRWEDLPLLQLNATTTVDVEDVWLITDDGIAVLVNPIVAPFLEETILCSTRGLGASLSLPIAWDLLVAMPVIAAASAPPSRRRPRRRWPRLREGMKLNECAPGHRESLKNTKPQSGD